MSTRTLDLDAARRETEAPDGIEVVLGGQNFLLPAELPVDVFDPFFTDEFDLGGLLKAVLEDDEEDSMGQSVVKLLLERPQLPMVSIQAVYSAFEVLFGVDDWPRFKATRPSIQDYGRLLKGLFELYGTSLGEAFASVASSANGGPTPKPILPGSTPESTPETSGDETPQDSPASSV